LGAAYPDIKTSHALNEYRTDSDVTWRDKPHCTEGTGASQPPFAAVHHDQVIRPLSCRGLSNENKRTRTKSAPLRKQLVQDAIAEA
jgi:hypothetical protein